MEFLINVFTNFIFEKRFSHDEALVTVRVTSISNNLYCINSHKGSRYHFNFTNEHSLGMTRLQKLFTFANAAL